MTGFVAGFVAGVCDGVFGGVCGWGRVRWRIRWDLKRETDEGETSVRFGFVSGLTGLGSPAVVGAFADFFDDFADKGVKVVGGARCDDPLLAHNRFVLPERTGIEKVGFD